MALALEECLGLAAVDPDIMEAKDRLLRSNFLSPDMFVDSDTVDDDAIDRQIGAFLGENDDEFEAIPEGDADEEVSEKDYDPQGGIYSNVKYSEGEDAASETMKLLSSPDYKLRPSIFTTVASIANTEADGDREDVKQRST